MKNNNLKKFISFALSIYMVAGLTGVNVYAGEADINADTSDLVCDSVSADSSASDILISEAPECADLSEDFQTISYDESDEELSNVIDDINASRAESASNVLYADPSFSDEEEYYDPITTDESLTLDLETYNKLNFDAFKGAKSFRGVQGIEDAAYGHYFNNWFIDDISGSAPWTYEGTTYHFKDCSGIKNTVRRLNEAGITVSYQFLLKTNGRLCEPAARAGSGSSLYYAINVTEPEVKKEWAAYFDYLAYNFSTNDCHIDNWILGNEVSMPTVWNWFGTYDANTIVNKYSEGFMLMNNAVRKYTDSSRVSVSIGNTWNHNDQGRGVPTKQFFDMFDSKTKELNGGKPVIWCISYHPYPAILYETNIWGESALMKRKLNPVTEDAQFVDGANLNVMTEYVKTRFGSDHRIMMTEFGSSAYMGEANQAACLAYTYYACRFNDMVDCFIYLSVPTDNPQEDFYLAPGRPVTAVWDKLESTDAADVQYIKNTCFPVIGISDWREIVKSYSANVERQKIEDFVERLYVLCLKRASEYDGKTNWTNKLLSGSDTGANVAYGFFFSEEAKRQDISNEEFVERLYNVMLDRPSDAAGKADWVKKLNEGVGREGVFAGFTGSPEYKNICESYGINVGSYIPEDPRSKNPNLTQFVNRMYVKALNRPGEVDGLNYWCDQIQTGGYTPDGMASAGFFESVEFNNRNLGDEDFVETAYQTFFDRPSDAAGKADWLNRMHAEGYSRMDVINGFCGSEEFANLKATFGIE